jgi:outer membrane protein assembly factor BamB
MVAILRPGPDGEWEVAQSWSCFPRCHGPVLDRARGTFIVLSSRTDQAMEVDMATGKKLWCANNIRFGKGALILDEHRVLVTDCNGRRLVELGRKTGVELWSCPTPGIPYQVAVLDA